MTPTGMAPRIALIFPPLCDPRAPQLALPSLAAVLRQSGTAVSLHDANLAGILHQCTPARLARTHAGLLRRLSASPTAALRRAVDVVERLFEQAPAALRDLRGPDFFDPIHFAAARAVLDAVLRAASLAQPPLDVGLTPIRYNVAGADPARLRDLIAATAPGAPNLFDESSDALVAELARRQPLLSGITITNRQQLVPGLALARRLREKGQFVVLGGALLSKFREELRARPDFFRVFADAVVCYEGETAIVGLVDALARGGSLEAIPNLLFLQGGQVVATSTHVEDVRRLPTPDFTGLPLGDYLTPSPVLPILTGKGCYFNRCKFCDIPFINHISKKAYRVRDAEQVVADVHALHRRHGATHFVITDEALSPRLLGDLADAFAERPGAFAMTGYARPEPGFTAEACRRFAGFGLRKLFFGLESGSQATLDHMDKAIRIAKVPNVLANCRAAGIDFHLFGIIGLPQESPAEARRTLEFLLHQAKSIDHPGNSFDVHPFGLELRTRYYEEPTEHGIVLHGERAPQDFPVGVDAADWDNPDGMSGAEAERMIADEMMPALRRRFADWHGTPDPLWPPQEEYSVLYATHGDGETFPWRSRAPADLDETAFAFAPSPVAFGPIGNGMGITTLDLSARLPEPLVEMLSSGLTLTWREHLARTPEAPPIDEARDYVAILIDLGLLAIRVSTSVRVEAYA